MKTSHGWEMPEGYRELEAGEIIQEGDLWWDYHLLVRARWEAESQDIGKRYNKLAMDGSRIRKVETKMEKKLKFFWYAVDKPYNYTGTKDSQCCLVTFTDTRVGNCLAIYGDGRPDLHWTNGNTNGFYEKSFEEIFDWVKDKNDFAKSLVVIKEAFANKQKEIKIGTHLVGSFTTEGFKVGCQDVSWETAEKIMARRPKA